MSMFRSAADISSSDPDSSSEEGDHGTPLAADDVGPSKSQGEQDYAASRDLEELLLEEEQASLGNGGILGGALDLDADGHAAVMTSALLEFYCLSRAADFLNGHTGSPGRFTRESPEAKKLGKQMYQYKSQFLSKHGIIPGGIDDDDWERFRQYYRDNLDMLGNTAVEGMSTPTLPHSRPPSRGSEPGPKPMTLVRTASHEKTWDLQKRYPGYDNQHRPSQGFVHFNNLLRTPQHPSEPMTMTNPRLGPSLDRSSRYASEFLEVRLLGRGSFGQVFEVKHHVDGQNYAVKKIPLSKERLEMLQKEGVHHFEHILKEIRTLARLDHKNVVRYFGAWVEEIQEYMGTPPLQSETEVASRIESVEEDPAEDNQSFGIIFGLSSNGEEDNSKLGSPPTQHTASRSTSRPRQGSHFTNGSSQSIPASNGEDDDDVESIQRNFSLPEPGAFSHGLTSTWDRTDTDIFTNDNSEDVSKLQLSRVEDPQNPSIVLHIQMSLHPLTLSTYLSPQIGFRSPMPKPRHCFHILPSLRFLLGILSGVEYLHSKGIIHRDLKPANIFLSSREDEKDGCNTCRQHNSDRVANMYRPRIGDFGLVADISHCADSQFSQATTVQYSPRRPRHVGTEFYCPRKSQFASSSTTHEYIIDEKLDVFALGVILFELTYRINTKMERQIRLSELTRGGMHDGVKIPDDFEDKIDCGRVTLPNGMSVGQSLSKCIQGMLHPDSRLRFRCRDVRKSLQELIAMVEDSIRW